MTRLMLPPPSGDMSPGYLAGYLASFNDILERWANGTLNVANRELAFGSGVVTWPGGSAFSNALTVAHGLGVTPIAVVVTDFTDSGLNVFPVFRTSGFGGTNFSVQAATVDGQLPLNTATSTITWLAIG